MHKKEELGYGILGIFILVSIALIVLMAPYEPLTTYAVANQTAGQQSSFSGLLDFAAQNFMIISVVVFVLALGIGGLVLFLKQHLKVKRALAGIPRESLESVHNYIKTTLAAGFSREQVKKALIDSGWQESAVEALLSHF